MMNSIDDLSDDSSEIMKVDPIQLVCSLVQAAEGHGNSDVVDDEDPLWKPNNNPAVPLDSNQPTTRLVRPETKEFLQTLQKYLDCRKQMDAKYLKVDELETLANFNLRVDSGGIELLIEHQDDEDDGESPTLNHGPSLRFKPEYQQQSVDGKPVRNLNQLYEAAEVAFPVYQRLIHSIIDRVEEKGDDDSNIIDDTEDQDNGDGPEESSNNGISVAFAPLKGRDRAQEKARDDYSKRTPDPGVSWLFDIVRGSILFSTADQMLVALQVLQEDPSIHVVKAKNRFRNPGLSGYRDWNIHIRIQVPKPSSKDESEVSYFLHMCEVQMHHQELKALDKLLHSHQHYEYFRVYFAGATTSLRSHLADLELIDEGFSLPGSIDDGAFLESLLETKPKEEEVAEEVAENNGGGQGTSNELSTEEARLVRLGGLFSLNLNEVDLAIRVYGKLLSLQLDKYKDHQHVQIGHTFDLIGCALVKQGKYESAMILHHHAFEIKKAALGDLDQSLAESYKNLAYVFEKTGKLPKALEYCQKGVDLYTQIKGEESYEVGYIYGGMALILRKQNKVNEALELYQKALRISIKENGEDDKSVAYIYNGMAWIYKYQGNLEEALRFFQLSHDIFKRLYGDQHSSLCFTYNGMADILKKQDKLEEALEVYNKSVEIAERRNGPEHPSVFFAYSHICKILKKLGRGDELLRISQMLNERRESKKNARSLQ